MAERCPNVVELPSGDFTPTPHRYVCIRLANHRGDCLPHLNDEYANALFCWPHSVRVKVFEVLPVPRFNLIPAGGRIIRRTHGTTD